MTCTKFQYHNDGKELVIENIYAALNVKCIFISPNRIKETIYTNFYDGI